MKIKKLWNIPYIDSYYVSSDDLIQLAVVFAAEVESDVELKLSDEHQSYEWLDYDSAVERLVWPGHKEILNFVHKLIITDNIIKPLIEIKLKG